MFDDVRLISEGRAVVSQNGLYFHVDENGNRIYQESYDIVGVFVGGVAYISKNEKYGFVNRNGKIIAPVIYDNVFVPYYPTGR